MSKVLCSNLKCCLVHLQASVFFGIRESAIWNTISRDSLSCMFHGCDKVTLTLHLKPPICFLSQSIWHYCLSHWFRVLVEPDHPAECIFGHVALYVFISIGSEVGLREFLANP